MNPNISFILKKGNNHPALFKVPMHGMTLFLASAEEEV